MEEKINGRRKKPPQKVDFAILSNKELLSSKEAAAFLDISVDQIYKLSASGKIPTYSPTGGKIYFLKSDLEQWVLSKKRASVKEINSLVNNHQLKSKKLWKQGTLNLED